MPRKHPPYYYGRTLKEAVLGKSELTTDLPELYVRKIGGTLIRNTTEMRKAPETIALLFSGLSRIRIEYQPVNNDQSQVIASIVFLYSVF
jgi:hypothetical protein